MLVRGCRGSGVCDQPGHDATNGDFWFVSQERGFHPPQRFIARRNAAAIHPAEIPGPSIKPYAADVDLRCPLYAGSVYHHDECRPHDHLQEGVETAHQTRGDRGRHPDDGGGNRQGSNPGEPHMSKRSRLGLEIEAGLREAIAYQKGEVALETRVVQSMSAARIREIRKSVSSSPKEFERRFGIPARTVEGWEQGRAVDATARVLLTVIEKNPDAVEEALTTTVAG
jgi:putative transcriptional regulator